MTAKRKWRMVVLAVVAAVVCLFHAPILRGLARLLIVDQPTDNYDCICISPWGYHASGDRCYDVAAELYRRKPSCRVLLVATAPNRLEEIGAMPSFESTSRRQLLARDVPEEAVAVLRGEPWNDWANAEALAAWMSDHPGQCVLLLSEQFHSGQMRRAIDDVLRPDAAAAVHVSALRNRDYDDTNWWTRRCGYRAFGEKWLLRLQRRPDGGNAVKTPRSNADDYERDFLHALPGSTP
jgi:hypothetical protein